MTAAAATTKQYIGVVQTTPKADLSAWLAVAAGTLGALMATLDISIVNSSLPTIQGAIGASGTEGTWIPTAYLVAEIIVIPLAAWLAETIGLRTFLLSAAVLFTGFSILCGVSTTLTMMIIGRAGQGFTGGAMIPTAQTIIATRLPRSQQAIGNALFGVTAILGPVIGPVVGGYLTENISWHYAFLLNVPLCGILVALLMVGLPHRAPWFDLLREADWFGVFGLAFGLGGLTVLLEEGERELWFDSPFIQQMAILSVLGFGMLVFGQLSAKRPVIRLALLRDRQCGAVILMSMVLGMVLYGTSYAIPQFLAVVADYNALQAGWIVLLAGIPSLLLLPFTPLLMRRVDLRIAVGVGLAIMAISSYLETDLTAQSTGGAFAASQILRGIGTILGFIFLSQAIIQSVPRSLAGDAAGLFNAARNLGGSLALAGISILEAQRSWLHARRIEGSLNANSVELQEHLWRAGSAVDGERGALHSLARLIEQQAFVMTYNDLFLLMAMGTAAMVPLVVLLRPLPENASIVSAH